MAVTFNCHTPIDAFRVRGILEQRQTDDATHEIVLQARRSARHLIIIFHRV